MEIKEFLTELKKSLVQRGIKESVAQKYVSSMTMSMSPSQRTQISSYQSAEDFSKLSDNLASAILKKESSKTRTTESANENRKETPEQKNLNSTLQFTQKNVSAKEQPTSTIPRQRNIQRSPARATTQETTSTPVIKQKKIVDTTPLVYGPNGKKIFTIGCIVLSPLLLAFVLLYFAFFGFLYVFTALLMAACILVMFVSCVAGGAFSLAGLIYGIMRYFTVPCEGKYEIGLALIVVGAVTILSIILYHAAINWLPLLFRCYKKLFIWLTDKLITLFKVIRKECYKL